MSPLPLSRPCIRPFRMSALSQLAASLTEKRKVLGEKPRSLQVSSALMAPLLFPLRFQYTTTRKTHPSLSAPILSRTYRNAYTYIHARTAVSYSPTAASAPDLKGKKKQIGASQRVSVVSFVVVPSAHQPVSSPSPSSPLHTHTHGDIQLSLAQHF